MYVAELYNSVCLNNRMVGLSNELFTTPPNELITMYNPVRRIENDNDTQYNTYYIQDNYNDW